MTQVSIPTTRFRDGTPIPLIGLGTYGLQGPPGVRSMVAALSMGYRLLDTAAQYGNEAAVGEAIHASGIPRGELFVTTKVAGGDQGRNAARRGVEGSLRRLNLVRCDLVLIHWPNPSRGLAVETWQTLLDLKNEGLIAHAGVSNFSPAQLTELYDATGEWPELNQIQLSPALPRQASVDFHAEHGILTQAWGPLGQREGLMDQFVMKKVAAKHGVKAEQVALRWAVDQGFIVIPKSSDPERQRTNADLDGFRLDDDDRALLASLDLGDAAAWDPTVHEEW